LGSAIPSGDDVSVHAYYSMTLTRTMRLLLFDEKIGEEYVATQYPNVIHIALSLVYFVAGDPLLVMKAYGLLEFMIVVVGMILYLSLFKKVMQFGRIELVIFSALLPLFSYWILRTLAAGSLMYLFDILVVLPSMLLTLYHNRTFLAGLLYGLSCLNWLGFSVITVAIFSWIITRIVTCLKVKTARVFIKELLALFSGFLLGGNVFLLRFLYYALFKYLPQIPLGLGLEESSSLTKLNCKCYEDPSTVSKYVYLNNAHFLYLILIIVVLSIAYLALKHVRRKDNEDVQNGDILVISLNLFWLLILTLSIMVCHLNTANAFEIQVRLLRTLSFMSTIPLASLVKLSRSFSKMCVIKESIGNNRMRSGISIVVCCLLLLSLVTSGYYFKLTEGPDKLIRANHQLIQEVLHIRKDFLKNEQDVVVLTVQQVGSYLLPLLSIPQQNVNVFLLTPLDQLHRLDKEDPQREFSVVFWDALYSKNCSKLFSYNVRYLVVVKPTEKQFYWSSYAKSAKDLWDMNFSDIGSIIYQKENIKLWSFCTMS